MGISKVLLVDDGGCFRRATANILNTDGFVVIALDSQKVTPEVVAQKKPDLILCGLDMVVGGIAISKILAADERTENIPFVLMSFMRRENWPIGTGLDELETSRKTKLYFLQKSTIPEIFLSRFCELVSTLENL